MYFDLNLKNAEHMVLQQERWIYLDLWACEKTAEDWRFVRSNGKEIAKGAAPFYDWGMPLVGSCFIQKNDHEFSTLQLNGNELGPFQGVL